MQSSPGLFIHWQEFHWLTSLTGPSHGLGAGVPCKEAVKFWPGEVDSATPALLQ